MRILVTDGDTRAGLAIVRSLGQAGHDVLVGAKHVSSLAAASRFAVQALAYPDPLRHVRAFAEFVAAAIEHYRIDALLPVTDITTLSICQYRDLMPVGCALPFPDLETVKRVADKDAITALAVRLGVDVPRSITLNTAAELADRQADLRFPLVIKPARSRVATDQAWIYTAVSYAHTLDDLRMQIEAADPRIFPVLLQEKIIGPGLGVSTYTHHGKTLAAFAHRRLREKPPSGGVSVLRESVPLDPLAYRFADELLQALNWHGVAMVEFKIDQRDQRPKLMEINGRFWGSLQLAIDAGMDFPRILIDSLTLPPAEPLLSYSAGVRTRWLWGDVDALLLRILRKDAKQDLSPGAPTRGQSLLAFLRAFGHGTRHEIEHLDDLGPAWKETRQWLGRTLGLID